MNHSGEINKLAEAVGKIQAKLPAVGKDSKGYNYEYASLPEVTNKLYPLMAEAGLSVSQILDESLAGGPAMTTVLMHDSGQWISGVYPLAEAGMKGVNNAQQFGAAITYARRYGLLAVLGVPVADDDAACLGGKNTDGQRKSTKPAPAPYTFDQARAALKAVGDPDNLKMIKAKMKDMELDGKQKDTLRDLYIDAQNRIKESGAA